MTHATLQEDMQTTIKNNTFNAVEINSTMSRIWKEARALPQLPGPTDADAGRRGEGEVAKTAIGEVHHIGESTAPVLFSSFISSS